MQEKCKIFAKDGLSNIFDGALVLATSIEPSRMSQYKIVGYRLENPNQKETHVICRSAEDSKGIYRATLHFKGVRRRAKHRNSSFFPKKWSREEIITKICEARQEENFLQIDQELYIGRTLDGVKIGLLLDEDGKVFDAMPVSDEFPRRKRKLNPLCKQCGQTKHMVCFTHHTFPTLSIRNILRTRTTKFFRKFYRRTKRKLKLVE